MKKMTAKKVALTGILGALALVLSFTESLLMPQVSFLPPGAKPGLSNIITMFAASTMGFGGAIYIVLIKSVFAFITRGATAFLMSLAGGIFSAAVMLLLLKFKSFSLVGIGVASSCAHNLGQLSVSVFITGTKAILSYAPFLLLFGVATGLVTGTVLKVVMPKLDRIKYD